MENFGIVVDEVVAVVFVVVIVVTSVFLKR